MGNICGGNSEETPPAEDNPEAGSADPESSTEQPPDSAADTKPSETSAVVDPSDPQSTPPEQIAINHSEGESPNKAGSPHSPSKPDSKSPHSPHSQSPVQEDNQSTTTAGDDADPDDPTAEGTKKTKRNASIGLQLDSVLGRETGDIKEVYDLGRKLGQGQFGTTFLATDKVTGEELACKSIAKRKLLTVEDIEDVRREIQIMHHLAGHPNVIQIIGAYEDPLAVHVVMELCAGGELFDRIIQRGHYTEKKAAELTRVIVNVVVACHSLGVMHRDLKPENFLFIDHEEDALLKTIDFGLSMFFKPGETYTDVVGSPYYVAPEVLHKTYGPECDIWSAGVIVYILLSGVPPFWDESEQGIFEQVLRGELDFVSEPWPTISESAKDLVSQMLDRDPEKRLTAHQVLTHPWVQVDGEAPDKPIDSAVISRLKQFSAMNKLKKMAIRVIAETLSEEEIGGLKQMFKMIDSDNSGQITLEELKIGLEKVGANLQDTELMDLMNAADVDNSGTIEYGEFIAAMLHLNKVEKEDHLFKAFSYFDKDGSGFITTDELQQACEHFGFGDVKLDEIIKEVDQDNDGRIDYSEFVSMMQESGLDKKIKNVS